MSKLFAHITQSHASTKDLSFSLLFPSFHHPLLILVYTSITRWNDEKALQMFYMQYSNDPSAGSPTETLLRLLLPLNHQVWSTLAKTTAIHEASQRSPPEISLNDSIGSSDGRCVQRSGIYSMQASDSHLLDIPGSCELFQSTIPTMKPVEWFPSPFRQGARLWLHCNSRAAQNI